MVLERQTAKVFAGNANVVDLGDFGSAKGGTPTNPTVPTQPTDPTIEQQIQTANYELGWSKAVVTTKNFPPLEEINGVLRTISYQTCYLLQEGIPVWDANTEYSNTSVVKVINGQQLDFYISQRTQSGNIPQTDPGTNWVKAIITGDREIGIPQITLNFDPVNGIPSNCVDLKGQLYKITNDPTDSDYEYNSLYPKYGTTYNQLNDPEGYFRLPDFSDNRALYGGASAGYIDQGLPDLDLKTLSNGYHNHTNSVTSVSNHKHDKGDFEITGRFCGVDGPTRLQGAFYAGSTTVTGAAEGQTDKDVYFKASRAWTGNTGANGGHTHTVTIDYNGSHTHTITHNGIIGSSDKIYTDGIKVRVFTRYK